MSERLKGQFIGCPYHGDDYESCIEYSGQAPCDPPEGWRPDNCRNELQAKGKPYPKSGCAVCGNGGMAGCPYERQLPAAPKWGGE